MRLVFPISQLQIVAQRKSLETIITEWREAFTELERAKELLAEASEEELASRRALVAKMEKIDASAVEFDGLVYTIKEGYERRSISWKKLAEFLLSKVSGIVKKEALKLQEEVTSIKDIEPGIKVKPGIVQAQLLFRSVSLMLNILRWGINRVKDLLRGDIQAVKAHLGGG